MHLTQREKKVENGDFGRKLGKVKSRGMVLSEKMMLSELASSSFFHLAYTQVRSLYIAVFRTFSVLSASTINPEF